MLRLHDISNNWYFHEGSPALLTGNLWGLGHLEPIPTHSKDLVLLYILLGCVFDRLGNLLGRRCSGEKTLDRIVQDGTHSRRQVLIEYSWKAVALAKSCWTVTILGSDRPASPPLTTGYPYLLRPFVSARLRWSGT